MRAEQLPAAAGRRKRLLSPGQRVHRRRGGHVPRAGGNDLSGDLVDIQLVSGQGGSEVPKRTSGGQVDTSSDTNIIYAPNNTYAKYDQVVYSCTPALGQSTCSGISGLTLGDTYDVLPVDGYGIQLSDPAHKDTVLGVGPGGSGTQVLTRVGQGPLAGLTDGDTYYVHFLGAGDFELDYPSGTAVSGISSSGISGSHTLSVDGIPITSAGSGIQQLIVDITGTGGGVMLGVGGPDALLGSAGDNVPSATSTGVSGAVIDVQDAVSTTSSTPTVNTTIDSGAVLVGQDIIVSGGSAANGAATATNGGGGLIQGAHSGAEVDITNTVATEVDGTLNALRDVQVLAASTESPAVQAKVDGAGLVAFSDANATANTNHKTTVTITGTISAGRTVLAETREGFNGTLLATANAGASERTRTRTAARSRSARAATSQRRPSKCPVRSRPA